MAAEMARQEIVKIAGERTATATTKLRNIPAEFYPFIAGPHNTKVNALEEANGVQIRVPPHHTWTSQAPPQQPPRGQAPVFLPAAGDNYITIAGDRPAVLATRAEIERQAEALRQQLAIETALINKGRHQFIIGERGIPVEDFFAQHGCAIILPGDADDETITFIGPPERLETARDAATDLAYNVQQSSIDISRLHRNAPGGAIQHANNITRYLRQRLEIDRLEKLHQAHIFTPVAQEGTAAPWELYSRDGKNAVRAQSEILQIINGHPPSRVTSIPIDPFFHAHLQKEISPAVKKDYGVHVVIPTASEADQPVLLVFEGSAGLEPEYHVPRGQPSADEVRAFQQGIEDARKHILSIIGAQAEIISKSIEVAPM